MDENTKNIEPGVALIKKEYIVEAKLPPKVEADGGPNPAKRAASDASEEEPSKKKRGQNKQRPRMAREPRSSKLCRYLWCMTEKQYNEAISAAGKENGTTEADVKENSTENSNGNHLGKEEESAEKKTESAKHPLCPKQVCDFSHDVAQYLGAKIEDFDEECHNFTSFGQCEYGLACRFGKSHIKDNFNVINEDLWAEHREKKYVSNAIQQEAKHKLRGKVYEFYASDKALADANAQQALSKASKATEGGERIGPAPDEDIVKLRPLEKRKIDWEDKLYLAPLTTLGNLPFRRICKRLGADVTCGEMAVAKNLLQGGMAEWALVKRHTSEDLFGVQLCGSNPTLMVRTAEVLSREAEIDFIDINMGCPIDLIYKMGAGSRLMERQNALELMVRGMSSVLPCPLTVKMRTSVSQKTKTAHNLIPKCRDWGAQLVTLHGRSREQRYTKYADWDYIKECAEIAKPVPLFGNGDVLNYQDYYDKKEYAGVAGIMIGRGALMKPWIFTEIKEKRHWDISSSERFDILKEFVNNGMEYWGSDFEGIEKTRRFLLEWLSFLHRYIPLGLLERPPQRMNQKPPLYIGRNDLETLMISKSSADWIKISEMLLGPVPDSFVFLPKHKANAWSN